jgi:hypothetical protein
MILETTCRGAAVKNEVKDFLFYVIEGLENKHLIYPCSKAFCVIIEDHAEILAEKADLTKKYGGRV